MNGPTRALPSAVPTARPVNAPKMFVSVYERAIGTPIVADGITSGFGETVAPISVAVSVYGVKSASDVLRASTVTSHTPASGLATVRLVALPVLQLVCVGM